MKFSGKKIISVFLAVIMVFGMFSFTSVAAVASCTNHNFDNGIISVEPTCSKAGQKIYNCLDCGCVKTELVIPSGHVYDENYLVIEEKGATCITAGVRTYTLSCPVCEEILLNIEEPYTSGHKIERLAVIEYPDCNTYGKELWGCVNCDLTEIRQTFPQHSGLKGTGEWDVCEDYCQTVHCYVCGGSTSLCYSASHNFIVYEVIKEATCTESGTAYVECSRFSCQYYNGGYMTISSFGHDLVWEQDVAPDCGMIAKQGGVTCSICGYVYIETIYSDEYFEHDFKIDILTAAQGETKGKTLYTCQNETWSSMYHVFTVEYFVSDVIPEASDDGIIVVNTDKTGVAGSIRDITGLYEENISFEVIEENNASLDEDGNIIVSGNGYIKVVVKTPVHEAVLVIETKICDTLEIIAENEVETGRVLEFDVIKNPGSIKATDVQWSSSDENIVFVSDGRLVAVGTGTVVLTATVGELTVSKEITLVASTEARGVTFIAMDKMHYVIEDYYALFTGKTLYWSDASSLRFKVRVYGTFPFETYIVYMNGKELKADADGYYTISADSGEARISVTGAMFEENEEGVAEKVSFLQAIINFFKKLLAFFGIK